MRCYGLISGLKINVQKSLLFGIGITHPEVDLVVNRMGINQGTFLLTYLGFPLGVNMNICRYWQPVIDKFQKRLTKWKSKCLSIGGRLTLVQSVLSRLPLYFFSLFKAPEKIIEQLERLRRRFFWAGKSDGSCISWVAWADILTPKSLGGLGLGSLKVNGKPGGLWKSITKVKDVLSKRGMELQSILSANEFVVADVRLKFDTSTVLNPHHNFLWNNWVPKKVNVRNWRASRDRLPTLTQLYKRGITPCSLLCSWCNSNKETIDHILTACPLALEVWEQISSWCKVQIFAFHVSDLQNIHFSFAGDKNWRKMINAIILATIWSLWKARNDAFYRKFNASPKMIFEEVRSLALLWIVNKANQLKIDWDSWCNKPSVT
uniref:uncharacterized protein LOC122587941 n=1 Tax=Erigeron canadensis TaxID=72917 RepID=UPI001CB97535|nr:uncharacterized protein LOC122587941 [Erigeron canadensis]